MAGSLNRASILGRVGKDPEINSTQGGKEIASFSVATSDVWRDKATGEKKERTEWHRIVVYSESLVGIIKQYVRKGSHLYIDGAIQTRKWSDKDGVERYTTEIVLQGYASKIMLLDSKGDNEQSDHGKAKQNAYVADDIDDSIPY